jgi:hypothetical protein
MRAVHLIPAAVIAPFAVLYLTRTITGEPLSAVILALLIFITVTATFTGASASAERRHRR